MAFSYSVIHLMQIKLAILALIIIACTSCATRPDGSWKPPLVHRVDVQQGNVVDQTMINKLKPGMDKKQVSFILGTPLLQDPFHSNRWEYLYSYEPGGGQRQQRHITVHFIDDKLAKITGDIEVTNTPTVTDEESKGKTVVVPLEDHQDGFFSKLFGKTPESKQQKEEPEVTETTEDTTKQVEEDTQAESKEETALVDETKQSEDESTTPADEVKTGIATKEEEKPQEDIPEIKKAETNEEKSIFRRLWDRVTSSEEDSTDENQETERDKRDAEVFESVGGGL